MQRLVPVPLEEFKAYVIYVCRFAMQNRILGYGIFLSEEEAKSKLETRLFSGELGERYYEEVDVITLEEYIRRFQMDSHPRVAGQKATDDECPF